ncbi:MAG: hypothetical protein NT080_06975 [Spirochaetes bacterium]|nr:hypothetical protein [Spirochaetota bacterium]
MTENEGRAILHGRFEAAGLRILDDQPLTMGDVKVLLDGFDPSARVGYEFITAEAGDYGEFTPSVIDELEARILRGELFVLLVDEREIPDVPSLGAAADEFLGRLRSMGKLP